MDHGPSDSSGTDDDIPPPHMNREPRGGGRVGGNGRSSVGALLYERGEFDMESQIHQLEQEAYSAVLRAFIGQSDTISWDKEGLISDLRKELRVSDVDHRELLGKVNADDVLRHIREYRKGSSTRHIFTTNAVCSSFQKHALTVSASRKRQKTTPVTTSLPPHVLPRTVHTLLEAAGKGVPGGVGGRKSKVISSGDIRCEDYGPLDIGQGEARRGVKKLADHIGPILQSSRGRAIPKGQSTKGYASSQNGTRNKEPDSIELRETDKLIKEVERVFRGDHLDPANVEKAKAALKEHEQSLFEAITRLGDASDEEDCRMPQSSHIHIGQERVWGNRQAKGSRNLGYIEEGVAQVGRREGSDREPMLGEDTIAFDDQQDNDDDVPMASVVESDLLS